MGFSDRDELKQPDSTEEMVSTTAYFTIPVQIVCSRCRKPVRADGTCPDGCFSTAAPDKPA